MRGQLFSIDVFVAGAILTFGLVALLFTLSGTTSRAEATLLSTDLLIETVGTPIRDLNYDILVLQAPEGTANPPGFGNATNRYDLWNRDMTLGEVIGEYHALAVAATPGSVEEDNYTLRRDAISGAVYRNLVPRQYNFNISIYDDTTSALLDERGSLPRDEAKFTAAARTIVAGIDRNGDWYGPFTLEVLVWG